MIMQSSITNQIHALNRPLYGRRSNVQWRSGAVICRRMARLVGKFMPASFGQVLDQQPIRGEVNSNQKWPRLRWRLPVLCC